jgi:hypothetical protein
MTDGGMANTLVRHFCATLGVKLIVNAPYASCAKGQVEQANNLWERKFEAPLIFRRGEIYDFADLNRMAEADLARYNATVKHTRHGMTRFAAWMSIEQRHLIETAPVEQLVKLATGEPATPKVSDRLTVRFDNAVWDVRHVPGAEIRKPLEIAWSPFVGAISLSHLI